MKGRSFQLYELGKISSVTVPHLYLFENRVNFILHRYSEIATHKNKNISVLFMSR